MSPGGIDLQVGRYYNFNQESVRIVDRRR